MRTCPKTHGRWSTPPPSAALLSERSVDLDGLHPAARRCLLPQRHVIETWLSVFRTSALKSLIRDKPSRCKGFPPTGHSETDPAETTVLCPPWRDALQTILRRSFPLLLLVLPYIHTQPAPCEVSRVVVCFSSLCGPGLSLGPQEVRPLLSQAGRQGAGERWELHVCGAADLPRCFYFNRPHGCVSWSFHFPRDSRCGRSFRVPICHLHVLVGEMSVRVFAHVVIDGLLFPCQVLRDLYMF